MAMTSLKQVWNITKRHRFDFRAALVKYKLLHFFYFFKSYIVITIIMIINIIKSLVVPVGNMGESCVLVGCTQGGEDGPILLSQEMPAFILHKKT